MIQHMIDDRKENVESVRATASDILANTKDAAEKQAVSSQLDAMDAHWNSVIQTAASQQAALESALTASKDYYSKAEPLNEWLESVEKKSAGLDAASANVGSIQKQIDEQTVSGLQETTLSLFC